MTYALLSLFSLLDVIFNLSQKWPAASQLPLKGIFQGIKLIGAIIVGILMISLLIGQSPAILISGLGAMAAVLMLVFKDPILGRLPVSSFPPTICSNWATGWRCQNMAQMARSLILA